VISQEGVYLNSKSIRVQQLDSTTGDVIRTLLELDSSDDVAYYNAILNQNGTQLCVTQGTRDGVQITLYDLIQGKELWKSADLLAKMKPFNVVTMFSPDESLLLVQVEQRRQRNPENDRGSINVRPGSAEYDQFAYDAALERAARDIQVLVVETKNGKPIQQLKMTDYVARVNMLAFSPDNTKAIVTLKQVAYDIRNRSTQEKPKTVLYDIKTGEPMTTWNDNADSAVFLNDSESFLLVANERFDTPVKQTTNATVGVWTLKPLNPNKE
jgi:hypothetical protein